MLLVTGANGFIGSALVGELNVRDHRDLIISDFITPSERSRLLQHKEYSEFVDASELLKRLKQEDWPNLEGVFHLGACSTTTEMNEAYLKEVNTHFSQTLFEICADRSIPYIYASSAATYGDGKLGFDDLADPSFFTPLNPYGWSKLHMDVWAAKQTKAPPYWCGLRFFNVYGPNEYFKGAMASVVYKAFHQIRQTERLKLFKSYHPNYKDGEQLRDFIYIKDITQWMIELFQNSQNLPSGVFNMGSGQAKSWLDLAQAVFLSLQKPVQIDWIEMPDSIKSQYQYFTEAKMDRFRQLGLHSCKWSLNNGIEDYIKHFLLQDEAVL